MKFGIYAPNPNVAVGSPEVARAVAQALHPLEPGRRDAQFDHAINLLMTADALGFELTLFAERHLGNDIGAWIMASAIGCRFENMQALVAVHPGLWHPVMTAKLATSLDRICKRRMAINIVNGRRDEEMTMFGGEVLQGEARYECATEFIDILRGLCVQESFSLSGKHYQVDQAQLLLKPAGATPPEIFSVSTSDRGRDFIAQTCDWWFIEFPKAAESTDEVLRSVEASISDMNRRISQTGRKIRYALNPFLALGKNEEDALEATTRKIIAENEEPDAATIRRGKLGLLPATKAGCIGQAEKVRRQIKRFEDMGIELLLLKMVASVENVRWIAEDVIVPLKHSQAERSAAE
jgi:dimethylsulfone monooxygenase